MNSDQAVNYPPPGPFTEVNDSASMLEAETVCLLRLTAAACAFSNAPYCHAITTYYTVL